jgi:GT2 family glycosyltransferase
MQNLKPNLITVVIPTYNRDILLKNLLKSLRFQSNKKFNVIVVDNSGENKSNLCDEKRTNENIKFVYSLQSSSSAARNLGWKKATTEYIAFIDDDAVAEKDWIKNINKFIKQNPNISMFGGPYERYFITKKIPSWFPDEYGVLNLGNKTRKLNFGKEWITGTNLIIKKSLLLKIGGFNEALGIRKKKLGYGEEIDLLIRGHQAGFDIYYSPTIKVRHLISKKKLNLKWLITSDYLRGIVWYRLRRELQNTEASTKNNLKKEVSTKKKYLVNVSLDNPIKRNMYYVLSLLAFTIGYCKENIYENLHR